MTHQEIGEEVFSLLSLLYNSPERKVSSKQYFALLDEIPKGSHIHRGLLDNHIVKTHRVQRQPGTIEYISPVPPSLQQGIRASQKASDLILQRNLKYREQNKKDAKTTATSTTSTTTLAPRMMEVARSKSLQEEFVDKMKALKEEYEMKIGGRIDIQASFHYIKSVTI